MPALRSPLSAAAYAAGFLLLAAGLGGCDVELPQARTSEPQQHVAVYGQPIFFGLGGDSHRFTLSGWSHTEDEWTWTEGIAASLMIQVRPSNKPLTLRLAAFPFVHPPDLPFQPVEVSVNGQKIASWRMDRNRVYRAVIPAEFVGGEKTLFAGHPADHRNIALLYVDFYIPRAQAPFLVGAGGDWRRLGIGCSELVVNEGAEEGAAEDQTSLPGDDIGAGGSYKLGTRVTFGAGGEAGRYKIKGWHDAERSLTWIGAADSAVLGFLLDETTPAGRPLVIEAKVSGNVVPPRVEVQQTLVYANGRQIADWRVTQFGSFSASVPGELVTPGQPLTIEFRTPNAISPKALGTNPDERRLSVALHEFTIKAADPDQK